MTCFPFFEFIGAHSDLSCLNHVLFGSVLTCCGLYAEGKDGERWDHAMQTGYGITGMRD